MTGRPEPDAAADFAGFSRLVAEDRALAERLRPIGDRAALVRIAVAEGAARGLRFTAAEAEAVMLENRHGWIMHPAPILPFPAQDEDPADAPPEPGAGGVGRSLLAGWTPFRAGWIDGAMTVDWCHLGSRRLTAPFFYESIAFAIGHPFNAAFRRRTRADDLAGLSPGLRPGGFIFHMARCGSTLCAQMLAADPGNIVASEPLPVRAMLDAPRQMPVAPDRADGWLAGILNALGRPRFAGETRFFVKFMAADVLDLPRILRLYPDVPWLFLYRDPLEILASQLRQGGADTVPGAIPPARLGLTIEEVFAMPRESYQLHALAAFGRAALDGLAGGNGFPGGKHRGLVLRYDELAGALHDRIPAHFGIAPTGAARQAMAIAARNDAKAPQRRFSPDGDAKRREAAPWRALAERVTGPVIAALDAARTAMPGVAQPGSDR